MRILHLINYFNDNLDYQENKLIKLQNSNGHKVSLITSDRYFPFSNYDTNYKKILGKRLVGTKKYFYKGAKIIRKKVYFETKKNAQCFFFNIIDVIKFKPDVIHIHNCGTYTFISTLIYSSILKKKVFVDCHQDKNNTSNSVINKVHNFIWLIIYKIFNSTIENFLPINKDSEEFIKDKYNIKKDKIITSPLGYEKFNKSQLLYKKRFNYFKYDKELDEKSLLIINSGKQNYKKKTHFLIELVKILNQKKIDCKLLLIGNSSAEYNEFLKNKIRNVKNIIGQNKIIQLPFLEQNNLRYYLNLADIAIWPGTPSITIQESLFADNILMLPEKSASFELLSSKYLVFHDNLNKTANNLIKVIKNRNILNSIKLRNKRILKKISWYEINKELENLYEKKSN